ncbi:uncharacterized protein SCODWIG_02046 [Saccharomycodes ludwigii]|uniref:Uncharacterized protein n=1 Tax=Saccharomycodes ludwigii TaxID=36035 RepID=A0A376B6H1_9ASCO|nr:uncharacterized protein SCODWIG_02046 [Saccharomycodes ludwigii]
MITFVKSIFNKTFEFLLDSSPFENNYKVIDYNSISYTTQTTATKTVSDNKQYIHNDKIKVDPVLSKCNDTRLVTFSKVSDNDNIILLGSTGLTGSLILENLTKPWIYLPPFSDTCTKKFLDKSLGNFKHWGLSPTLPTIEKTIYCFNRHIKNIPVFTTTSNKSADTGDDTNTDYTFLTANNELDSNCFIKIHTDGNNKNDNNHDNKENIAECIYGLIRENIKCKTLNNETINSIGNFKLNNTTPDSSETQETTVKCSITKLEYNLSFQKKNQPNEEKEKEIIKLTFKFNIIQIIEPDSSKWSTLITNIFQDKSLDITYSSPVDLTIKWKFPNLLKINVLVSALGSNSFKATEEQKDREYVDYYLNFQLSQIFCDIDKNNMNRSDSVIPPIYKKIIVITSFNSVVLSTTSDYFHTKWRLENDLFTKVPHLNHLVILRPGPLIGSHNKENNSGTFFSMQEKTEKDNGTSCKYMTSLLRNYNKSAQQTKLSKLNNVPKAFPLAHNLDFKTKVSEMIAAGVYHRKCSWMFGYAVPVKKVALQAALKAIESNYISSEGDKKIEFIKSEDIDRL